MRDADAALIALVVHDDDRSAFAALVNRHQVGVRTLLTRLCAGDRAQADDLAQETFLRVYRRLITFDRRARFTTWLYRVTYNVFLDHTARRRAESSGEGVSSSQDTPSPALADQVLARHDLARAFAAITPAERAALTLAYAAGCAHPEIAQVLDCPLGTVKTLIARGKEKLRQALASQTTRQPRTESMP
jgi:RNA polymerase sigma factor (sigma-70 family)